MTYKSRLDESMEAFWAAADAAGFDTRQVDFRGANRNPDVRFVELVLR